MTATTHYGRYPMHQRDFILRIIEQLGAVLAEIRRRIVGGEDPAEVQKALADAAGRSGLNMDLLRHATLDTLHMFAAPTGDVEPARCWLMAEMLYLDGLQASLEERDADAHDALVKARSLYDLVRPAGGLIIGLPEAAVRLEEIDRMLEPYGGIDGAAGEADLDSGSPDSALGPGGAGPRRPRARRMRAMSAER